MARAATGAPPHQKVNSWARVDPELLSYQYLQMLPQLAKGDANKVFVIPSEFAEAFGGLTKAFASGQASGSADGAAPEPPPPSQRQLPS